MASPSEYHLQRHVGPWAHASLAWAAFALMGLLAVVSALARRLIGEAASGALLVVLSLALVLALPWLWRRFRARGAATLLASGGVLRLRRGEEIRAVSGLEPRTFRYRVAAGTYRVPAFMLRLEDGATVTVAVPSSPEPIPGGPPEVTRPEFLMEADDWDHLVRRLRVLSRGPTHDGPER